ncbi:MAG: oligosaccharide flippase family protein [Clostridia bacterium]|nr:oligosaccharide flippase family protein [Clostridia bacterium]
MSNTSQTRVGSNAVKLTAAKFITLGISMVSSMLLARFRSLTEYGTYSQMMMAVSLVSSLLMLGLPNSINYFLGKAKSDEERADFLSVYYTLSTLLSLIVGAALVASVPLLEIYFKNDLISTFWYFLATYPWTRVIMSGTENLLIAYNKSNMLMVFKVLNSILLLAIILIIQVFGGTFVQYIILYLVVEGAFTLWTYIIAKKNAKKLRVSFNKELIKSIFKFSVPIGLASVVGTLNIELDKLVITSVFSTEDLAIYTNASKELPVSIIATSITAVLLPQVVKLMHNDKKEEAVKLWKSATTISFAIISFIAIACFVFAPEVIEVMYSAKYLPGVSVFRVYCLVLFCRCTYFGMMLNATGKTKFILYSSIGTLLLNFSLNYLFYTIMGFTGPAVATLITTVVMAIIQLLYTSKRIKVSFASIFPWKNCGLFILFNGACGAAIYAVKSLVESRWEINSIVCAIALGIVWLGFFALIMFKPLKKQWTFLNKER